MLLKCSVTLAVKATLQSEDELNILLLVVQVILMLPQFIKDVHAEGIKCVCCILFNMWICDEGKEFDQT